MDTSFYSDEEGMPGEQRQKYYNEKIRWIVEHAYRNSPAMKRKLDQADIKPSTIRNERDMQQIPVTTLEEIIELQKANPPFGGLMTVPPNSFTRLCMGMGTEIWPMSSSGIMHEMVAKTYYAAGVRKGDIMLSTIPFHPIYSGWVVDAGCQRLGVTLIPAGWGNTERTVEMMRRLKPTVYQGIGNSLIEIIRKSEELGYNLRRDFPLRLAIVGGEKLSTSLRSSLENDYGITIRDSYAVGRGAMAYECGHGTWKHVPEQILIEVVDPVAKRQLGPMEPGEPVVTYFDDRYPLLRFATGDITYYTDEPCACGRTSRRLAGWLGRIGEAIKVKERFMHPKEIEGAVRDIPEILDFQVVVTQHEHRDVLTFNVELARQADRAKVGESLRERIRTVSTLEIDNVNVIEHGALPHDHKRILDTRVWD